MKRTFSLLLVLAMLLAFFAFQTASASTFVFLHKGSKGDEVVKLQTRLAELGYYTITIDGDYGNGTVTAVKAFQKDRGLVATGVVNRNTYNALFKEIAETGPGIRDIEKIMDTLMELPHYTDIRCSAPVKEEGGVTAYKVMYGNSSFYVMFNPDRGGAFAIVAFPDFLDEEEGSYELLDFLAFLCQAASGSDSTYDMYFCVVKAFESGKHVQNEITYEYGNDLFVIRY